MTATFAQYLDAQLHRDDPVGDLARDAEHDPEPITSPDGLLDRMGRLGASVEALAALARARTEWEATR